MDAAELWHFIGAILVGFATALVLLVLVSSVVTYGALRLLREKQPRFLNVLWATCIAVFLAGLASKIATDVLSLTSIYAVVAAGIAATYLAYWRFLRTANGEVYGTGSTLIATAAQQTVLPIMTFVVVPFIGAALS